ncbi:MAG: type I restriction enzyme HsdR N-terminal domain-containing protein [Tannerellaceae bacterium]|jgi:hypothetical protein|nr:type I restriction enzyme HsdR N-terminal domain-containing protein [Tannerellaceae bacterium]
MDFKDTIKQVAERVEKMKNNLNTEEATKNALIMPFIQALGYDVFDPLEVVPEYICDIGTKKGEKIDYAIIKDGKPVILIECKHWGQNLNLHDNQLLRYFNVSNSKFGILTNGVLYRFYTDLSIANKMDEIPFLEINMENLTDDVIEELRKFHKSYFDLETIMSVATELKYTNELKKLFASEFTSPNPEFVKYFAKQIYGGSVTSKVLDMFTELTKKTLQNYINDKIKDKLKSVIEQDSQAESKENIDSSQQEYEIRALPAGVVFMSEDGTIVTTQEEIEAFYIVRSILRQFIDVTRITYRDSQSYFSIFIDNNSRKPVCRLFLNSNKNKQIVFFSDDKKEVLKYKIEALDDIYKFSEQLITSINKYINN